ncbi:peptide chain release factor N(5)-glutamine methyltransferase [Oceaniglobus indicus]|uniref:peptide chain release factor N(5)-glutamine methyltransferase n=1 Tax=Oceaniglobus indicus TaxID=2047749 RepID=UPI000C17E087|nr:peptide chain release factor N(5)-glutamine methyltransferase [Oceaniglobus indicus]
MPDTGADLLRAAVRALRDAGVPDPAGDARHLLAAALGVGRDRLTLVLPDPVAPEMAARLGDFVAQRCARRPVSRIIGRRAFFGHDFIVTPDVLDPRPDTETLIELALLAPFANVLDLGTGSGCILIALLAARPDARGVGTDLSEAALDVARRNADAIGVARRAEFRVSDWFAGVSRRFDLIVSNPPYIAAGELDALAPEVREHDPAMALSDGADGLGAYRAICRDAAAHLRGGGRLLVEIGPTQGDAVAALFNGAGFGDIRIHPDIDGRARVVSGVKPPFDRHLPAE